VGQRSSTENQIALVQAFLESRVWKQAELARRLEMRSGALRKRLDEMCAAGFSLPALCFWCGCSQAAAPRTLNVEFTESAQLQVDAASASWKANRPYAPPLFADELTHALELLAKSPLLASVFDDVDGKAIRKEVARSVLHAEGVVARSLAG
jgi:hypothetical protein